MADYGFHQGVRTNDPKHRTPRGPNKLMDPSEGPLSVSAVNVTRLPNSIGPGEYPPFSADRMPDTGMPVLPKKENTMDVYIIWVTVPDQPEAPWAVTVWDDASMEDNEDGWLEALATAEETFGARYVRVTKTTVNYDAVIAAFEPVSI